MTLLDAVTLGPEIFSRTERCPVAAHHHDPHRGIEAQVIGNRTQLVRRVPRPRVQLLRTVELDLGHAVVVRWVQPHEGLPGAVLLVARIPIRVHGSIGHGWSSHLTALLPRWAR